MWEMNCWAAEPWVSPESGQMSAEMHWGVDSSLNSSQWVPDGLGHWAGDVELSEEVIPSWICWVPTASLCSRQGWRREAAPPFPHTPALAALGIFQALLTGLGICRAAAPGVVGFVRLRKWSQQFFQLNNGGV